MLRVRAAASVPALPAAPVKFSAALVVELPSAGAVTVGAGAVLSSCAPRR